jgi:hypothetical protein
MAFQWGKEGVLPEGSGSGRFVVLQGSFQGAACRRGVSLMLAARNLRGSRRLGSRPSCSAARSTQAARLMGETAFHTTPWSGQFGSACLEMDQPTGGPAALDRIQATTTTADAAQLEGGPTGRSSVRHPTTHKGSWRSRHELILADRGVHGKGRKGAFQGLFAMTGAQDGAFPGRQSSVYGSRRRGCRRVQTGRAGRGQVESGGVPRAFIARTVHGIRRASSRTESLESVRSLADWRRAARGGSGARQLRS